MLKPNEAIMEYILQEAIQQGEPQYTTTKRHSIINKQKYNWTQEQMILPSKTIPNTGVLLGNSEHSSWTLEEIFLNIKYLYQDGMLDAKLSVKNGECVLSSKDKAPIVTPKGHRYYRKLLTARNKIATT